MTLTCYIECTLSIVLFDFVLNYNQQTLYRSYLSVFINYWKYPDSAFQCSSNKTNPICTL